METLSVRCNHCGAPLEVAEKTRFVTCQFCHSSLEVKRTDNSIFTEEVAKIAENTGRMAESLEVIELQNELERLDREQATRRLTTISREGGGATAVIGLLMVIAFGCFFAYSSAQHGAPAIFPLFGGGFVLIGIIHLFRILGGGGKSPGQSSLLAYEHRRAELTRQLEELRQK